jgi:hypothetical protein
MGKRKPLVDKNYRLCGGCQEIWHLQAQYACDKCLFIFKAADLFEMSRSLLYELKTLDIGIKERPMIERE